jgi:hypothetical protein
MVRFKVLLGLKAGEMFAHTGIVGVHLACLPFLSFPRPLSLLPQTLVPLMFQVLIPINPPHRAYLQGGKMENKCIGKYAMVGAVMKIK